MMVAAAFGLASALSVVVLGDESGYTLTDNQKMKLAAIEAMWKTEPAPASGLRPPRRCPRHPWRDQGPYLMGLIGTRADRQDRWYPGTRAARRRAHPQRRDRL
jgi:cytochrome d ubiquinol oxidase subunit I